MTHERPEDFTKKVGEILRKLRKDKAFTLEELADLTGVSKLTLGKIERGEANPSLTIIWKIANGLRIPISSLMVESQEVTLLKKSGNSVMSENQSLKLEPVFTTQVQGSIESHKGYLQPDSIYEAEAHQLGVKEYITVMEGEVVVRVGEEEYQLERFDSIKFNADQPHAYMNHSGETAILHFVMIYSL
ncbi:XRE family transcriptional regulator [Jeotgalibacillus salarius]|uniref:XRE family transcriptional regulator n=1 Tax=Jeotgalibacillus salarius TaxID=546023 RepID=A0A4Y8LHH2_9BACL|nr:XRE family transcriptional regulator [Jeotgalibacillus salarius]TFE02276.1 XRE family transcriptional regulator [Jeotgalibacillus salarius]